MYIRIPLIIEHFRTMKTLYYLIILFIIITPFYGYSQQHIKVLKAKRIDNPPEIDGSLSDQQWQQAMVAKDFLQIDPRNGVPASQPTEVKILYDDDAVYVGAMLYEPNPDSILTFLSKRDHDNNADIFGVYFDPYNDGLNAYGFFVTSAGVQMDMKSDEEGHEDLSWDAVWKSAVSIGKKGWVVELEIPYSALRFSEKEKQTWGLNFFRHIQRYRELDSWNFVDKEIQGFTHQSGQLTGIYSIEPPLRLSFVPYVSGYIQKRSENENTGYSVKGGLDLKYGISESFTLDMMVIPDFGQVQSDDKELNLTPYELYYSEKRNFFTDRKSTRLNSSHYS